MSRHADPPDLPEGPRAPEPTFAERARTLLHVGRNGALSTLSRRHPGHPFGSVMPYAPDTQGRPVFLLSTMAMHTQNLETDPRASLLVRDPSREGDPLAGARMTLLGEARRISEAEVAEARRVYLPRHQNAHYWVDFDDFAFHRLEVVDVYYVGGFAAMGWVSAEEYRAARPDPLADEATTIIEHMNRDHPDALKMFSLVLAGAEADEATMISVDRLGFKLRLRSAERLRSARIPFSREVATPEEARAVLIEMLEDARAKTYLL